MKKGLVFAALLAASVATGANAQHAGGIRARACDPATYDHTLIQLQLNPPCASAQRFATHVNEDGVAFEWGATVDFAAHTRNLAAVGPEVVGIWVKVGGLWYIVKAHAPNADGTTSGEARPLRP